MIAKSDLVILVVSASALAVGIARWQINVAPDAPPARIAAPPAANPPANPPPVEPARLANAAQPGTRDGVPAGSAAVLGSVASAAAGTTTGANSGAKRSDIAPTAIGGVSETVADPSGTTAGAAGSGELLYGIHEVVSGDSLGEIALRFGTSVATLRDINDLDGTTILVGQSLRYPQAAN